MNKDLRSVIMSGVCTTPTTFAGGHGACSSAHLE